jgi:hypothetical protein
MPRPDDPGSGGGSASDADRSSRIGLFAGLAVILVAIGVAVAFALPEGTDSARVVTEVVRLQALGEEGPPATLPDAGAEGVTFSRLAAGAGWRVVGSREDRVDGRDAATAIWERAGRRVGQTVLAGAPLGPPEGARRTGRRGILLYSLDVDGRTAVTWTEDGRTAVISSLGVSRAELYDLAGGPPRR